MGTSIKKEIEGIEKIPLVEERLYAVNHAIIEKIIKQCSILRNLEKRKSDSLKLFQEMLPEKEKAAAQGKILDEELFRYRSLIQNLQGEIFEIQKKLRKLDEEDETARRGLRKAERLRLNRETYKDLKNRLRQDPALWGNSNERAEVHQLAYELESLEDFEIFEKEISPLIERDKKRRQEMVDFRLPV